MVKMIRSERFWAILLAAVMALALVAIAIGCGSDETTTTKEETTATTAGGGGKIYVAVTGEGELEAGAGNMGLAIVDLETKEVEMVNIDGAAAPHGVMFTADTAKAPDTRGRTATEAPKEMYLGNAQDGKVLLFDPVNGLVTTTIDPPAGASLAVCGMQEDTDGIIWLSSMGDGKVYPLDPATNTIGEAGPGGGDITTSICGISWSADGQYAYLNNMTADPGYIAKVKWPSGELVSKIENVTQANPGLSVHQNEVTPDGKYMYVTGGADNTLVKIDMATDEIVDTIAIGGETHSIVFTEDGKTAYIAVRHQPVEDECSIYVYDVEKDEIIERIPGIKAPLICGIVLEEG